MTLNRTGSLLLLGLGLILLFGSWLKPDIFFKGLFLFVFLGLFWGWLSALVSWRRAYCSVRDKKNWSVASGTLINSKLFYTQVIKTDHPVLRILLDNYKNRDSYPVFQVEFVYQGKTYRVWTHKRFPFWVRLGRRVCVSVNPRFPAKSDIKGEGGPRFIHGFASIGLGLFFVGMAYKLIPVFMK